MLQRKKKEKFTLDDLDEKSQSALQGKRNWLHPTYNLFLPNQRKSPLSKTIPPAVLSVVFSFPLGFPSLSPSHHRHHHPSSLLLHVCPDFFLSIKGRKNQKSLTASLCMSAMTVARNRLTRMEKLRNDNENATGSHNLWVINSTVQLLHLKCSTICLRLPSPDIHLSFL